MIYALLIIGAIVAFLLMLFGEFWWSLLFFSFGLIPLAIGKFICWYFSDNEKVVIITKVISYLLSILAIGFALYYVFDLCLSYVF